eukprot:Skav224310  [mRNA]  locus=scaffold227:195230:198029:+ [translate_table: standard]
MGNNCCATNDGESTEETVNKQPRVQDIVESLHSSVAAQQGKSTDMPLLEKMEGGTGHNVGSKKRWESNGCWAQTQIPA